MQARAHILDGLLGRLTRRPACLIVLLVAALLLAAPATAQDPFGGIDLDGLFDRPDTSLSDGAAANAAPDGVSGAYDCAPQDRDCQERVGLFTQPPDTEDPGVLDTILNAPDFDGPGALSEAGLSLPDIAICEPGRDPKTATQTTRTEYRCEAGVAVEETTKTCRLVLVHEVDERYTYACEIIRNPDGTLSASRDCEILDAAPGCTRTGSQCTEQSGPSYTVRECRDGPPEVTRSETCMAVREHALALTHLYECRYVSDPRTGALQPDAACAALDRAGCRRADRSCTARGAPEREVRTCQSGHISRTAPATCRVTVDPVAQSRPVYRVGRTWNASRTRFEDDAALRAVRSAGCMLGPERCERAAPPATRDLVCEQGLRATQSTGTCRIDLVHTVATSAVYTVPQWQGTTGWTQPTQFDAVVRTCSPGPRTCAVWEETCEGGDRFCDGGDRWMRDAETLRPGRRSCLVWETRFQCDAAIPGAGAPVETRQSVTDRRWEPRACPSLPGGGAGCTVEEVCASGSATRTVDGLSVSEPCWSKTRRWSCPATQAVDTCGSRPASAWESARRCTERDASGTCRLWSVTWTWEEPDGSGGCHRFGQDATCPGVVSGLTPVRWIDTVGSVRENREQCARIEARHAACRWTRSSCTRFAPGSDWDRAWRDPDVRERFDRDCWEWELSGTCETLDPAPACQTDLAGCTQTSRTCRTRGLDGSCRLYDTAYDCPVVGSEPCTEERHAFQCDAEVPAAGTPVSTTARVTGGRWSAPDCPATASDTTCREVARSCALPGTGRPEPVRRAQDPALQSFAAKARVQEPCWEQAITYECTARSDRPACGDTTACTQTTFRCLQTRADGSCALREIDYRCEAARCEARTRICDPRRVDARQSGHKYICETLDVSEGLSDRIQQTSCTGLQGCHRIMLSEDVEHFTVDRVLRDPDETRRGRRLEDVGYLRRSRYAYYCESPRPAADAATYVGWVEGEGQDAETADCAALDANPRCERISEQCVTGRRRSLDQSGSPRAEVCAGATRMEYNCGGDAPLGQTAGGATCSGDCVRSDVSYSCDGPVEDAGEPVDVTRTVVARVDGSACEALQENETCALDVERCVEGPATRSVGSGSITAECWAWERDYVCSREVGRFDNCEPAPECTFREALCLARSEGGECLTEERVYDCVTSEEIVLDEGVPSECTPDPTDDGGPDETDEADASRSLPDALAALQSVGEGAEDHRTTPELFGGDPLKCSKLLLGTKNCCKRTGLLIGLGCGESSNRLRDARDHDRCIPLGSYCSKKALFGACLKKKETDCCYKSSLAKIVIETAVRQTGLDLGSAKRPSCEGLSVTQFQLLDLADADFSSVTADILSDMSVESPGDTAERLRRSIQSMQSGGTSGLPSPPPGG